MLIQAHKRIIPWIIASFFFIEVLDESIISTSIPKMALSLGVNPISLKAAIISYLISLAIIMPISGWFAEKWGTKRIIFVAMSIFLVGSICCGFSPSLDMLVLSRVIQGVGGAFLAPLGRIIMLHTFKKHELVKAMNYVIIPGLLGSICGPVLGGLIVSFFSWRFIFFINIPFCLMALYFINQYIPNYQTKNFKKTFDWLGFLMLAAGLGGMSFVMEGFGEHLMPPSLSGLLLIIFMSSIVFCYIVSRKKKHPVINFSLFNIQSFGVAAIATLFVRLSIACVFFLLPLMYQIAFGWPPWKSGLMVVPLVIGTICVKLYTPAILRRFGMKRVLLVITLLIMCVVMSFALITSKSSLWQIGLQSFMMGGCITTFFSACNGTAYSELEGAAKMEGISIYSTFQRVSTCIGVGVTAFMLDEFLSGNVLASGVKISVFHHTFIFLALSSLVAFVMFLTYPADIGSEVSGHRQ